MELEHGTDCCNTRDLDLVSNTTSLRIKVSLTWNPGSVIVESVLSNDWVLESERVVSSSMCAFTPFATALKYPFSIKFTACNASMVVLFTLKTPSVISTVPAMEQFWQLTVTVSWTESFLYVFVRFVTLDCLHSWKPAYSCENEKIFSPTGTW